MAKSKTSYIDVQRSAAAKRDMQAFSKDLEANVRRVNELLKTYQQLGSLQKSQRSLAAFGAPGGIGAFNRGNRTREDLRASQNSFLGSQTGRQVAETKALAASLRDIQKSEKDGLRIGQARALNLRSEIGLVGQISNLKDVQNKKELSSLRLADARRSKNGIEQQQARRLNQLLKDRESQLKRNLSFQELAAKKTERQQAAETRRRTSNRLFGDGGAGLFKIQAGLLFNYAAITKAQQGIQESLRFSIELDNSLRNLQAITRISDNSLASLRGNLIAVSEQTKFTAVEVTNAAVILGQAGLSVSQIQASISAVSLLATATGTDLERAVDITSSTLGVFNMEASQMAGVANTLTEAVNGSKLNIEKLTLGLQYSGNIAAQSGIRFEELTAALGAMANAGIRSGSTLGTGTRQVLIALQKPSTEFKATLDRLGLTMEDVNLKTKGLYGVLSTLKEAGFSSSDAIRSFEVRAAAAFKAIAGNLDDVRELEYRFRLSDAAMAANETQMRSLQNQAKRLGSVIGSVAADGMQPFLLLTRDVTEKLGDFFEGFRKNQPLLRDTVSVITSVVTAFAGFKIMSLIGGLVISMIPNFALLRTQLVTFSATAELAAITGNRLAFTMMALKASLPVIGLIVTAVAALTLGFKTYQSAQGAFNTENDRLKNTLDQQRAAFEAAQGKAEEYKSKIEVVSAKIQELSDRQEYLTNNTDILNAEIDAVRIQFAGMGYDLDTASGSVVGLIGKLVALRRQLAQDYVLNIRIGNNMIGALRSTQVAAQAAAVTALRGTDTSPLDPEAAAIVSRLQTLAPDQMAERSQAVAQLSQIQSKLAAEEVAGMNLPAQAAAGASIEDQVEARAARVAASKRPDQVKAQSAIIGDVLKNEQGIFSAGTEIRNLDRQQAKNNEEISDVGFQQNSKNYAQASDFLRENQQGVSSDRKVYQAQLAKDPLAAQETFAQSGADRIRRLEGMRDFIAQDSRFSGPRGTALLNKYDQEISDLKRDRGEISEASGKVKNRQVRRTQKVLDRDLSLSRARISAADSPKAVNAAAAEARDKIVLAYDNKRKQLLIGNEGVKSEDLPFEVREGLRDLGTEKSLELDQLNLTAEEKIQALNRSSGGGGSSTGAGRSANSQSKFGFNQMLGELKSRSGLAKTRLDTGAINGQQAVGELGGVLEEAKVALQERAKLIKQMSGDTSLTKDEQTKLNRSISEHKSLATFIRAQEEQILKLKEKHGLVQFNLTASIKEWADKTLNMTKVTESGLTSSLSAGLSGLSTLFQQLSTEPKKAGEAFKAFAVTVAQSMQKALADMLAVYVMQKVIGAVFGMNSAPGSFGAAARTSVGLPVKTASQGAYVKGNVPRDSVNYSLMPGEYVLRASAVQMMGKENLDQINAMGNRRAAHGGHVGAATKGANSKPQNLWLVDDRSKAPIPGPSDIIAIIGDDMAKNGSTGKMVQAISSGNY